MEEQYEQKSTVEEIRRRFDADVERFANLQTGQSAAIDSPLAMDLVTEAAATVTPHAQHVVDVGCGAGNYTLKLLARLPNLDATLIDLSLPMLERARQRVAPATPGRVETVQADVREVKLPAESCDIVLAASVLHHLRGEAEWDVMFAKLHAALRPGGSLWIFDLVESELASVQAMMWRRYGEYLVELRDETYREEVFAYVAAEDTPRPLVWQLDRLRAAGFAQVEVLHKNGPFAAFGAVKT